MTGFRVERVGTGAAPWRIIAPTGDTLWLQVQPGDPTWEAHQAGGDGMRPAAAATKTEAVELLGDYAWRLDQAARCRPAVGPVDLQPGVTMWVATGAGETA